IFNTCPLTFDGAYGLTKANHSIKYLQVIANNQDPHITKLLNENEDVLDHFYKVQCPFVLPYQRRLVVLYKLKHHLRATHKMSNSLVQKLVDDFKKKLNKN
ncbi:unnamed protein product, partial [Rotaria sordida]